MFQDDDIKLCPAGGEGWGSNDNEIWLYLDTCRKFAGDRSGMDSEEEAAYLCELEAYKEARKEIDKLLRAADAAMASRPGLSWATFREMEPFPEEPIQKATA